jgi:hypothetical protein
LILVSTERERRRGERIHHLRLWREMNERRKHHVAVVRLERVRTIALVGIHFTCHGKLATHCDQPACDTALNLNAKCRPAKSSLSISYPASSRDERRLPGMFDDCGMNSHWSFTSHLAFQAMTPEATESLNG